MQKTYPTGPNLYIIRVASNIYNWVTKNVGINYLLVLLFVYTAVTKLHTYSYFKGAMFKTPVLRPYVDILAWLIPSVEIAVSLLLLFNKTKKIGYYAACLLMTIFTGYVIFILVKYAGRLPCNCGGVVGHITWQQHLILNFSFLLLSVRAIYLMKKLR